MVVQQLIPFSKQETLHALSLAFAYFVTAAIAVTFMRFNGGLAVIWIANALLTADLRHRPNYSWTLRCLACGCASFLATTLFGIGAAAALPLAIINIGESLIAAGLMRRYLPFASRLETLREIAVLMVVPGMIAPIVTGFLAAAVPYLLSTGAYGPNWLGWVTGHSLGALTVLPFIKLVLGGDFRGWMRKSAGKDWCEAGLLLVAMAGAAALAFAQTGLPLLFLPMLPMMMAVFRIGRIGAAGAMAVLALVGIGFTLAGIGPVSQIPIGRGGQFQFLQVYLITAMLMTLPAAAELRRRNKLLIRAEEAAALHRVIADRTGDIILALEPDGAIRFASASIESALGVGRKDVVGQHWHELALRTDAEILFAAQRFMQLAPDETSVAEVRMAKQDGSIGWFESYGRATLDASGTVSGFVSVLREISGRKARELDLARAADTDPLTGLLNRRGFSQRADRLLAASTAEGLPGCVAVFDLDHFKRVNDVLGHAAGDELLVAFAALLDETFAETDLVARAGGEEFVAYLPGSDVEAAARSCEAVRCQLEARSLTLDRPSVCPTTVSIGLAVIDPSRSLAENLEKADEALYRAKTAGRNRLAQAA